MLENLESLVLHNIYLYLKEKDLVNLSQCSRYLYNSLNFNLFWRIACQKRNWMKFGKEISKNVSEIDEAVSWKSVNDNEIANEMNLLHPCYWRRVFIKCCYLEYQWRHGKYVVNPIYLNIGKEDSIKSIKLTKFNIFVATSSRRIFCYNNISCICDNDVIQVEDDINCIVADDRELFVASRCGGCIYCYDIAKVEVIYQLFVEVNQQIDEMVLIGDRICGLASDNSIQIWSRDAQCHLYSLSGHLDEIICFCSNMKSEYDSKVLVTGSWDCRAIVWDVENGFLSTDLIGHSEGVSCIKVLEDYVVTGSLDGSVRVWNWICGGGVVHLMLFAEKEIYCVEVSEIKIFASGSSSQIYVWNWEGDLLNRLSGHLGIVRHLHLFDNSAVNKSDRLISGGDRRQIIVWEIDQNNCYTKNVIHRNPSQVDTFLVNDYCIIVATRSVASNFVVLSFV